MNSMIPLDDVWFPQKRQRDDIGRVFIWEGRVFRAIFPDHERHVRELFSSGFLEELMAQQCIPQTWMTDYQAEGFSLVLEHEAIWPVVYPQEWTFSMLKDAALLAYKVATIAARYGFDMKDCHGLNVLFDHTIPKYSDLGSFTPAHTDYWTPYYEYLRFYYYPLKIWQHNSFVGKLSIFSGNLTTHESYFMYQYPFMRQLNQQRQQQLINYCLVPSSLRKNQIPVRNNISKLRSWLRPRTRLKQLAQRLIPIKRLPLADVVQEIEQMDQIRPSSAWASYHDEVKEKAQRFDRIIEIINDLRNDIDSAIDLGGNQGRFSRLLAERTHIQHIICVDYDENAVDIGYKREKSSSTGKITFVNYDFMGCIAKLRFMLPTERFKSDIAVALALSHHLLLSQGYDIDEIFKNIADYARKYILIEFMPWGLHPETTEPNVPQWYTRDWFRQAFAQHFKLIREEKLRDRNILFVGKL